MAQLGPDPTLEPRLLVHKLQDERMREEFDRMAKWVKEAARTEARRDTRAAVSEASQTKKMTLRSVSIGASRSR